MDKFRIFIVDDEWMAIEYLKALLKEASPAYEVVGEAFGGTFAYEQICRIKPDIIFIDIQMPEMNGLELTEKLFKNDIHSAVIFLTSYRDFDFIKKGMELGISSYMLKNELTPELLKRELDKIMKEVELEKKKNRMYTEYNIKNFLFSKTEQDEKKVSFNKSTPPSLERYAAVLFTEDRPLYMDRERLEYTLIDAAELEKLDFPEGVLCRNVIQVESGKWCAVFYINAEVSDSMEILRKAGKRIQIEMVKKGISVTYLYDRAVSDIFMVPLSFQKMYAVCECSFFYGKQSALSLQDVEKRGKEEPEIDIQLAAFSYTLDETDHLAASYVVEKILNVLEKQGKISDYRKAILEITGILRRYCERQKIEISASMDKAQFESPQEVKEYLGELVTQMFKVLSEQKEGDFSPIVGLAVEYIKKNYHKNISVQDIAAAAGVSEGHLRKCFKNGMDVTVVDYLTRYRIKKAKALMKKREYKISEIYEMVGFTSSQYFSYVFKKTEGKTPSEYMKSI